MGGLGSLDKGSSIKLFFKYKPHFILSKTLLALLPKINTSLSTQFFFYCLSGFLLEFLKLFLYTLGGLSTYVMSKATAVELVAYNKAGEIAGKTHS